MKKGYTQFYEEAARLTILKELAECHGGPLNETIISSVLDTFGYKQSREWVRTQILKLEELGAAEVCENGSVLVAEITSSGMDHIERRAVIEGVARPRPGS